MPDESGPAPGPKRSSNRLAVYVLVLLAVYLLGFVPSWRDARSEAALRQKAEHALTVTRLVKDLGAAAIDARLGAYEASRQEASVFFTSANYEVDQRDRSALTREQRDSLAPLLAPRDEIITLLARSDAAAADRLMNLFVRVRHALGV